MAGGRTVGASLLLLGVLSGYATAPPADVAGGTHAATTAEAQAVAAARAETQRARPYLERVDAVGPFATLPGCEGAELGKAREGIAELRRDEEDFTALNRPDRPGRALYAHADQARERHLNLQFRLVEAKAKRCLNLADVLYRNVTATLVGSSYAAYRKRARIGVGDVRKLRAAARTGRKKAALADGP